MTFAAAAEPRNRQRYDESPKTVPAGLASTTPPAPQPPGTPRPLTMPKLMWPEQLRWKANGRIDMGSLDVPFVLQRLLEWPGRDHPDVIDIAGPPDPEDENLDDEGGLERRKAEARRWDEENDVRPYRLRKWHVVEQRFPQPPHGIEGAAEHARIQRRARRARRKELAAAAAAAAAGGGGGGGGGGSVNTPGSADERRLRSPSGSASSVSGRPLPPELFLGTSPGAAAYIGSPRSLGRLSTLPRFGRPFADKDSYVGVVAQPSLRKGSPRGPPAGTAGQWGGSGGGGGGESGGGSGSGGTLGGLVIKPWGGGGGSGSSISGVGQGGIGDSGRSIGDSGRGIGDSGSGSAGSAGAVTPVAVSEGEGPAGGSEKAVETKKKARPEFERKTMGDEAFALFVPKWKEYDRRVDQVCTAEGVSVSLDGCAKWHSCLVSVLPKVCTKDGSLFTCFLVWFIMSPNVLHRRCPS